MYVVFRRERGEPVGYVQVLTRRARPVMIARMGEPSAFFVPDGERFLATALTRGPWSRDHQHGGPPSALLARAIERRLAGVAETEVVRLTVDFLRPLAIGKIGTTVRRSSEMVLFYDGIYLHYQTVNANRITARHGRKTQTNLAFFDGHATWISRTAFQVQRDYKSTNPDAPYRFE